jgi:hypothetical protein
MGEGCELVWRFQGSSETGPPSLTTPAPNPMPEPRKTIKSLRTCQGTDRYSLELIADSNFAAVNAKCLQVLL